MNFLKKFFHTDNSTTHLIIRVIWAGDFLPRRTKAYGLVWRPRVRRHHGIFYGKMGIPALIAFLVIIGESFGALGLITGFLTRLSAAGVAMIMLGAIAMVHWNNGILMNWAGKQAGEGYEYHLLALGLAIPLILYGGGKFSVDQIVEKKFLNTA